MRNRWTTEGNSSIQVECDSYLTLFCTSVFLSSSYVVMAVYFKKLLDRFFFFFLFYLKFFSYFYFVSITVSQSVVSKTLSRLSVFTFGSSTSVTGVNNNEYQITRGKVHTYDYCATASTSALATLSHKMFPDN